MSVQDQLFDAPDPPRSLDAAGAREAGEAGMDQALNAARVQSWKLMAEAWFARMPPGREFTNDNLWIEIGNPCSGANENNVVGAWIRGKSREGRIEHTGRSIKSARKSRHGNRVGVWRKLR